MAATTQMVQEIAAEANDLKRVATGVLSLESRIEGIRFELLEARMERDEARAALEVADPHVAASPHVTAGPAARRNSLPRKKKPNSHATFR